MNSTKNVLKITAQIPKGRVTTYKMVAEISGVKNPRVVGNILHKNKDPQSCPCHRVVNSKGEVAKNYAFGGGEVQRERLQKEGIVFEKNKIDLKKYLWQIKSS